MNILPDQMGKVPPSSDAAVVSENIESKNKKSTKGLSGKSCEISPSSSKQTETSSEKDSLSSLGTIDTSASEKASLSSRHVSVLPQNKAKLDQQIRITRVHKLLVRARLSDSRVSNAINDLIKKRMIFCGHDLSKVTPEMFRHELANIMLELDERGISLGHPGLAVKGDKLQDNLETTLFLTKNYEKIQKTDEKLTHFMSSHECEKWDSKKPVYRGGDYYFESKIPRNLLKNKSIYKPGSINVGNVYFGKGLYVSDDIEIAKWYAKFSKNSSLVKMHIKENTSIIDFTKPESEMKLQDALGLEPDEIKKYLQDLCHHPLLLKHYREESDPYITIKSPEVVTQCDLSDDLENWHKPSLNRLDAKTHEIKGHPTQFKEIKVPDGTKMTRVEEATAKGNALCDGFPCFKL